MRASTLSKLFGIACAATWACLPARADTEVCGALPLAAEWTAAGSPYLVTNDLFIPANSRLRIGPGVTVRFAKPKPCADTTRIPQADWSDSAYAGIKIEGTFYCLGSEDKPVVFEPQDAKAGPVGWDGIRLTGQGPNEVEIAFSVFRGANQAVTAEKAGFYVHHCLFEGNNTGVALGLRGDVAVINCAFIGNLSAGIALRKAGPRIVNSVFSGNHAYAIWADGRNSAQITYNDFWNSGEEHCYHCPFPVLIPKPGAKDSADAFGNLAVDPLFEGSTSFRAAEAADPRTPTPAHLVKDPTLAKLETASRPAGAASAAFHPLGQGPYLLSRYSKLTDAGHPGRDFRDRDGTRCDIGLHGGSQGRITRDPF